MRPKNYDPLIDGAISMRALISVLEDLKRDKVFTKNSHELQLRKVSYSTQLNSSLIGIGLIDKYSKKLLVTDFNIGEVIKKIKLYAKGRKGMRTKPDIQKYPNNYTREMTIEEISLSKYSDSQLVKELRERGFEVRAIKMIEL